MKGQIIYTPQYEQSTTSAEACLNSFQKYEGWDITCVPGLITNNWQETHEYYGYKLIREGRLYQMRQGNDPVYATKMACVYNNVKFWHSVAESNKTMMFVEHDIICRVDCIEYDFEDYLIMNMQDAISGNPKFPGTIRRRYKEARKDLPRRGIYRLEFFAAYPLRYYKRTLWYGAYMVPGTACYLLSPSGAEKLINAAETFGLDQSDFIINNQNAHIEFIIPSPVKFNEKYISTSYGQLQI